MIHMNDKSDLNPYLHHRRSIRLKEYHYSQAGAYFITICTMHTDREHLFGQIVGAGFKTKPVFFIDFIRDMLFFYYYLYRFFASLTIHCLVILIHF